MVTPLSLENPMLPIWHSLLDGRYLIEVQRIDASYGNFLVFDALDNHKELFHQKVPLRFGAAYGPDVEDVYEWQEIGVKFVDGINPLTVEKLLPDYESEMSRLHMLIHKYGMAEVPKFDDPVKLLTLIDSIRMTCQKLEEIG